MSVGHRLQRGKGLGRDDEEGFRGIEILDRLGEVGAIDIGNESERQSPVAIVLERLIGHHRSQVGAPDADVDDVSDTPAGVAQPGAAPDAVGKLRHLVQHGVDLGHHVVAVHYDGGAFRGAQGDVQHGSLFGEVDLFSPEHGVNPGLQAGFPGQLQKQLEGFVGEAILGVIQVEAGGFGGHPFAAAGIVPKEFPEMHVPDLLVMCFKCLPGLGFRGSWGICHDYYLPYTYFNLLVFSSIVFMRFCHDSLKDLAPSSCRSAASLTRSIPALTNSASTCSASPPIAG